MIYRVLFFTLLGVSIVLCSSEPSPISTGESLDAPPQQVMVDEEQPLNGAFQEDQIPGHIGTGDSNASAAGVHPTPVQEGVTGQPSVTEYKFSSDRNSTDSSLTASTLTAMAAVSLTILF
ncbi:hypothetical protein PMAYCL1PPCAC_06189 [Pristionchus mayeri]|uniref:Uncharacterized protein n=1 Tax=Pristionchus mayeri TaxID=1317129 RepID=A0AAN4Z9T5_9BILA|nr:hypothetical protein PMAYCL1PPCAC_06189 [Pristionchus mayeri]